MTTKKNKMHYAWWILIALSVIVGIGKGAVNNTSGLFLPGVTNELGIGMGTLTLYFSVSAITTMVFLPIGGKLMAKYDIRTIIVVGIVLQAGAFALFGLMSTVWGWYMLAIPLAIGGIFITVIVGPVAINQWFKTKNGLALGILSAAGGLFGAIAQPIAAGLIDGLGWRAAYITIGIAAIIIIIPFALFVMKRSPQSIGIQAYGEAHSHGADDETKESNNGGIDAHIAKKSGALYALIIFFFLITSMASFSMHIPQHLKNSGFDITFSGNVMSAYMIGVLIGSLVLGFFVDKIGVKNISLITMFIEIIAMSALIFAKENTIIITVAVAVFGLISAGIGILAPALTTSLFGNKDYSEIYATASLGLAISGVIALPGYGFVYDIFGSYVPVLYAIIIMLIINILCVLFAFRSKQKLINNGHWTS